MKHSRGFYVARRFGRRGIPALAALSLLLMGPARLTWGQFVVATAVTAEIRARQPIVLAGHPVWVDFTLHNPTDQVAVLYLRGSKSLDLNAAEMGLPLEHALGRADNKALQIMDGEGKELGFAEPPEAPEQSIALRLAPNSMVGLRVDLSLHSPELQQPGKYRLTWRPYEGSIQSNTIEIRVGSLKQARIETEHGPMIVHFFYEDAPRHVENFIELAEKSFYDSLTFHRLVPGYLIQGGAPNEEPAALRPDRKMLEPEFNGRKFEKGTLAMARRPSEPASASCQFFICATRWPELDGEYTAFGGLVGAESLATLDKLMGLSVDTETHKPLEKLVIRSIRIEDVAEPVVGVAGDPGR